MRLFEEGSVFFESLSSLSLRVGFFIIYNFFTKFKEIRTQVIVSKIPGCLKVLHVYHNEHDTVYHAWIRKHWIFPAGTFGILFTEVYTGHTEKQF